MQFLRCFKTVALTGIMALCPLLSVQQPAEPQSPSHESIFQALLRLAQANHVPLGIVQLNDDVLCKVALAHLPDHPADLPAALAMLARDAGYEITNDQATTVLRPQRVPDEVWAAMGFRFTSFPARTGTMAYLGMVLNGWLSVEFGKANGYATESASSSASEFVTLPLEQSASTEEIANEIVKLGSKGVWIAHQSQTSADKAQGIQLTVYSYHDDTYPLHELRCGRQNSN